MTQQQRIAELERALIDAILAIEGAYGSDAEDLDWISETVQHLARILNREAK